MKVLLAALLVAFALPALAAGVTKPKATPAQASAAIMRQADDFYVERPDANSDAYWYMHTTTSDLVSARCRGKGPFACTAIAERSLKDGPLTIHILAKARKAGGFCWAVPPKPIPSGCLAPGKRAEGSIDDVDNAVAAVVEEIGPQAVPWFRATPHGSGFYSWYYVDNGVEHRGTVVFSPAPIVKVLS